MINPKVPTKQNVSDLKNALAAVLKKGNQTNLPVPNINEVPEDVLRKVLNVD